MSLEKPVVISCAGDSLVGILHAGHASAAVGVVFVVGGPQYRAGSHRQFVMMARQFAAAGVPVLRFDYRGMGDSDGMQRSFEAIDEDIRAAIDRFTSELPGIQNVFLFGLCDAASAILMYAPDDQRVSGLMLMNPWVRSSQSEAHTYLHHYYLQRILQKSFWRKVFSGELAFVRSLREFFRSIQKSRETTQPSQGTFQLRMLVGLKRFHGPILIPISGRDLTAQEFLDLSHNHGQWKSAMNRPNVTVRKYDKADHTMSAAKDLSRAGRDCIAWLEEQASP